LEIFVSQYRSGDPSEYCIAVPGWWFIKALKKPDAAERASAALPTGADVTRHAPISTKAADTAIARLLTMGVSATGAHHFRTRWECRFSAESDADAPWQRQDYEVGQPITLNGP
jgi:hypothetical protein